MTQEQIDKYEELKRKINEREYQKAVAQGYLDMLCGYPDSKDIRKLIETYIDDVKAFLNRHIEIEQSEIDFLKEEIKKI
jgi:hypothetical protein